MTTRRAFAWACCLAATCLAASSVRLAEKETARADQAEARAKALEAKHSETTCEPVYQATWLEYECPPIVGSKFPQATKQVACTPALRVYRSGDFESVRAKARSAGPLASLLVLDERGVREKPLSVVWEPVIR